MDPRSSLHQKLGLVVVPVALLHGVACTAGVRYDDAMVAPSSDAPTATATAEATAPATTASASDAPTSSASPGPDAAAPLTLNVRGRDVDVDKAKGTVVWNPDQGVQKASYKHYRFKYDEYVKAVGAGNLEKDADVEATCAEGVSKSDKPTDPNLPAPSGGFDHRYYDCVVVRATVK